MGGNCIWAKNRSYICGLVMENEDNLRGAVLQVIKPAAILPDRIAGCVNGKCE